jgi:PQQ-dependent catabolism-associated CXXCW motif protein
MKKRTFGSLALAGFATVATLASTPVSAQDTFGQAQQGQQPPSVPQQPQQQFPQQQSPQPQAPQQFPQQPPPQQFPQQQFPQQQFPQQPFPPQQAPQPFPQQQQFPPQQPQQVPTGGGGQAQGPGGFGQPPGGGFGPPQGPANLDALMQLERQDYGVAATPQLHAGQMHGPTPASIPGGQIITTKGLVELIRGGQAPVLVLDVLGGPEMIQGAQYAVPAAQSGAFNDPVQQQFGQYLQQATSGNKQYPIVTYCLSTQCWMSYNAALRAINLGYTNVLWYRGGIEAWKQAGLPTQRTQ